MMISFMKLPGAARNSGRKKWIGFSLPSENAILIMILRHLPCDMMTPFLLLFFSSYNLYHLLKKNLFVCSLNSNYLSLRSRRISLLTVYTGFSLGFGLGL